MSGVSSELIQNFVVYGELMCNKGLFNYENENLYGKFPIFGAMIKPAKEDFIQIIV
jgi:hypothetical protein